MGLYTDRLLRAVLAILVAAITYGLEPFIGFYYAGFVAVCVALLIFGLLPVLYNMFFEKQQNKASIMENIVIILLILIGVFLGGAAVWDKTH